MKIGIINFETFSAGTNQLIHAILSELLNHHKVLGIEVDRREGNVQYKHFNKESLIESRTLGRSLLQSSPLLVDSTVYQSFLSFDAVIVIGTGEAYKVMETLTERVKDTKFLFVPVSIHNDIKESGLSLGYDTAINSIVENILKIRDTIDSLKYEKPRLFGVQVPGNAPRQMLEEIALAVEGFFLPSKLDIDYIKQLTKSLEATFNEGQTYSFLIFNEAVNSDMIQEAVFPALDIDWKALKLDEALCMGPNPTAVDRIFAMKMAQQTIGWIKDEKKTGKLLVNNHQVYFQDTIIFTQKIAN
jgi:6-phosphofructokinase 1